MSYLNQNIIGISGHIDHGKTSIVKALTGTNTDNLKEELSRGMTINIGFAFLNNNITIIDVPGHEKFIKNMVTGVYSINYALLVIAADDGIMPQTIEHFEILKLLNIKDGSIIINKIDNVDDDWLELVESEIKDFVKDSFLEDKTIHKVSTINSNGIDDLKNFLINYKYKRNKSNSSIPRLFVDRVFKSKGFGSIVTGTLISGTLSIDDQLKILPQNKNIKIRGLQTHNKSVNQLYQGDRCAINIHSLEKINIKRGDHISSNSFFKNYDSAIVKLSILQKFQKKIKHNERIRFYLGTQEVMARIQIYKNALNPDNNYAVIRFENAIVASINDYFIIRKYSPLVTIGGGKVVDFNVSKKWKDNKKHLQSLSETKNYYDRLQVIVNHKGKNPFNLKTLGNYLNISQEELKIELEKNNNFLIIDNFWILTNLQYKKIELLIIDFFKKFHLNNPYKQGVIKEQISKTLDICDDFLNIILDQFLKKNLIKSKNHLWSKYEFEIKVSKKNQKLMEKIMSIVFDFGLEAISIGELVKEVNQDEKELKKILGILISENKIVLIDSKFLFDKRHIELLIDSVKKYFSKNKSLDVKSFKELTKTSRKFSVPLLEFLDKSEITYRIGNARKIRT